MKQFRFLFLLLLPAMAFRFTAVSVSEGSLIHQLSDPSQLVRDSAAREIRSLIAEKKCIVAPGNIIEHDFAYWQKKQAQLKTGMKLKEAIKLLGLSDSVPGIGMCSGQSCTQNYQLDHSFAISIAFESNGESKIIWDSLFASTGHAWIEPPDNFTGTWTCYYLNGKKIAEYPYKNGKYDGLNLNYYDNGKISYQQQYTGGHGIGEDRGFYPSGALRYVAHYVNDKQEGEWIFYYEEGSVQMKENFSAGEMQGSHEWWPNGKMKSESIYKNGKQVKYRYWKDDGTLDFESPRD